MTCSDLGFSAALFALSESSPKRREKVWLCRAGLWRQVCNLPSQGKLPTCRHRLVRELFIFHLFLGSSGQKGRARNKRALAKG